MAGTVFNELCVLQVYKIIAGTVVCEVWHCPRLSIEYIVECIGFALFWPCLLASMPSFSVS